jgi:predicted RNase H-like nuclease (RuvC/YqgF family)
MNKVVINDSVLMDDDDSAFSQLGKKELHLMADLKQQPMTLDDIDELDRHDPDLVRMVEQCQPQGLKVVTIPSNKYRIKILPSGKEVLETPETQIWVTIK